MAIELNSLQTLVYIEYCNLIGSATTVAVAQVPNPYFSEGAAAPD